MAWTSKTKGDYFTIAGFGMYRAGVLKIAYEEESIYSDKYYICDDYSPVNCVLSKAVIIESENKSEEEFQRYIERAPEMLKSHNSNKVGKGVADLKGMND